MNKAKSEVDRIYAELKLDSKVDQKNLVEEACKQTHLYCKWSSRLAMAEANYRRVEVQLVQFKAESMRKGKTEHKTVNASEQAYRSSTEYRKLHQRLNRLARTRDLMQTGVYAMQHRRSAIECLVKLKASDLYNN